MNNTKELINQNEQTFSWHYWVQYIQYNYYRVHTSSTTVNFIFDDSSFFESILIKTNWEDCIFNL